MWRPLAPEGILEQGEALLPESMDGMQKEEHKMNRKCIGIDIGGTSVKIGIFESDGTLLEKWEVPTRREEGGRYILEDVAASIRKKTESLGMSLKDLAGAGMGLPGPVLPGGYVEKCVNLGWKTLNPQEILSGLLDGLPVISANDANVAALGEMWQGGGKGYKDLVMVTLGTGVGGGIILNQKILNGTQGVGGEIGHIHVRDEETERCNCGGAGCLEQVASATGIAREAGRVLAGSDRPSVLRERMGNLTAKDVLDAAKEGDGPALEAVETACRYLGLVLSQLTMILDPQIYVVGGGVSKAGAFLTEKMQKYHDQLTPFAEKKAQVVLAKLGNDAGIYGAARLILD